MQLQIANALLSTTHAAQFNTAACNDQQIATMLNLKIRFRAPVSVTGNFCNLHSANPPALKFAGVMLQGTRCG